MATIDERFWAKVNKAGPLQPRMKTRCWVWTAAQDKDGYGMFQVGTKVTRRAHRWVWEQERNDIPLGQMVCHRCDNPSCVRLSHLFLGTATTNNHDRDKKGRASKGEQHYAAKVTQIDIDTIRSRYAAGEKQRDIAIDYGISRSHVSNIVTGRKW